MQYKHPEVLVETDWVREHLGQPGIRIVEVDVDLQAYEAGHIPGAVGFNWQKDLQDPVRRDILGKQDFERLMNAAGIARQDTVVLYGDNKNWFAAYAFWLCKLYDHPDLRLMNGGREKWLNEKDKPMDAVRPDPAPTVYRVERVNGELRASLSEVLEVSRRGGANLVDVRSPAEFNGEIIAPPGMSETAQRGGPIPGARNVPWSTAVREDGSFKSAEELHRIYVQEQQLNSGRTTIAYCRIGERSSHTWFVLKYLLGFDRVTNYDGSWTEWGNLVGAPVEKGVAKAAHR
jgi:thiosulfate/3-mercaptopyruvate sulfurtransferase